jgi:RimJ/RimL family protein N-acetyltransferase
MIRLRNVYETKHAYLYLYRLLEQRRPEESISHTTMPSLVAHKQFVLAKPYRMWCIVETMQTPEWVGAVLLTQNNEIGISIDTEHRRKGYARAAIERVLRDYQPLPADASKRLGCFVANINPANEASIKLFTGLGAVHIQNTFKL